MFDSTIQLTPFVGPLADLMFRRISGREYNGDNTFVSALRALLWKRIPNEDSLNSSVYRISSPKTSEELMRNIDSNISENSFTIFDVHFDLIVNDEDANQTFNGLQCLPGFHEFKDVTTFFAQKMQCRAFINEEHKSTIVLIKNMDMKKYHLMQCIIPKLLPWYFNRSRLSVTEMNLLYSLREKTKVKFLSTIYELAEDEELQSRKNAAAIQNFRLAGLRRQKENIESTINDYNYQVNHLNDQLTSYFNKINSKNMELNGVLAALNDTSSAPDDLLSFLQGNRNIKILDFSAGSLSFILTGYLDVYDPEAFNVLMSNDRSFYHDVGNSCPAFRQESDRKKLLYSIFSDEPKFRIKTCGVYIFDMDRGGVRSSSGYHYGMEYQDYYPNPHLQHHACLGNYRSAMSAALGKGDIIGAISQCISSVHSVNVTESSTFSYTLRELFENTNKIIEDFNGVSYTPVEALNKLKADEAEAAKNNTES